MQKKRCSKFNEASRIFDEASHKCNEFNNYKPRTFDKIKTKNAMLEYLKSFVDELIDTFFSSGNFKKKKQCQL